MPRTEVLRRVAVIGDVHAEDEQLERALVAARALDVDAIACTGDVVDGRGSVARCCTLLRTYDVLCVRGNHDRWLFSGTLRDVPGATTVQHLSPDDRQFLERLPAVRELAIPDGRMLLCHGVGEFDLEKVTSYDTDYSLRTNRYLQNVIGSGKYRGMVNGHSHERLLRRVGPFVIVNAGTLKHPDDPGFVVLELVRNVVQWHSLQTADVRLTDEQALF
jgi:predicted phosphodiesterase